MRKILCTSECLYELYDLVLLLKESGYAVILAMSARRAIEMAARELPDAVVVSAMKTGPQGSSVAAIKANFPHLPVLLIARPWEEKNAPPGLDGIALLPDQIPRMLEDLFGDSVQEGLDSPLRRDSFAMKSSCPR